MFKNIEKINSEEMKKKSDKNPHYIDKNNDLQEAK